jgi:hypothetical protein
MGRPRIFLGSEALARGDVSEYELRRWHHAIFRDVYVAKPWTPTLLDRILAAHFWSKRRGVIAGVAASALHGAQWVDVTQPVELIWNNGRPPPGLIVRNETLAPDEVTTVWDIPVTTPARTAFDIGRRLPRDQAVARIDALLWAMPSALRDLPTVMARHPGARGVKALRAALPLVDGGAASPRETWLRLMFLDAGLPRPTTQLPVLDGRFVVRTLDMGWEDYLVGAEYDGDQHRTNRVQYAKDVRVKRKLDALGWHVLNVIKEDSPGEIVRSARAALLARGWRP